MKYVIVGAGLSGLTIAERIANQLNEEVLIIEKEIISEKYLWFLWRRHFNTKIRTSYLPYQWKIVYEYLSEFTEWLDYEHHVLSNVDGKLVPMPICIDTLNALYGLDLDEESMKKWIEEHKENIDEIKSSEDVVLKMLVVTFTISF